MKSVQDYQKKLSSISDKWNLLNMLGKMSNTGMEIDDTRMAFETLTSDLLSKLANEVLKKTISEMRAKAQVAVDIVIRNLFERTADIGFLATDEDIRSFLLEYATSKLDEVSRQNIKEHRKLIKNRFQAYVDKYSVYSNIILMDTKGNVLAQLDESNAITHSEDPLIQQSLNTLSEYIEIYRKTDLVSNNKKALIYSFRVKDSNQTDGNNIGVLSLVFKFEDEMETIFKKLIHENDWDELMLLDSDGYVISSSDTDHIRIDGTKMPKILDDDYKIIRYAGKEYIAVTCKTKGYQGYFGLDWYGHAIIPLDHAFKKSPTIYNNISDNIREIVLGYSKIFSEDLKTIPKKAEQIQKELDLTVWNGNVQICNSKVGDNSFSKSLLNQISSTGFETKKVFEDSINNLNHTVLSTNLDDAKFNASLAIEIMDRNLYERANDCRWWALTSVFKEKLSNPTFRQQDIAELREILVYINGLYTVYSNIFLYDRHGNILVVSNDDDKFLVGTKIEEKWVEESLQSTDAQRYRVSQFAKTLLYKNDYTYIYSAGITDSSSHEVVGGIGIVFDSKPQFESILMDTLPRDKDGEILEGSFALFADRNKNIIASSSIDYAIGNRIQIDDKFFTIENGNGTSSIIELDSKLYIMGLYVSSGYREYKKNDFYQNDVIAFVFVLAVNESELPSTCSIENLYHTCKYPIIQGSEETVDISTFYIGNKFFGIESKNILLSLSHQNITRILGSNSSFLGVICLEENETIGVISLNDMLKLNNPYNSESDCLIVLKSAMENDTKFAIVVNHIKDSPEIPLRSLQSYTGSLAGISTFTKSVVIPDNGALKGEMLSIIDIDAIYRELIKKQNSAQKSYSL